ncbi:hypothetical protein V1264_024285, partial [Littorina saxatilis]
MKGMSPSPGVTQRSHRPVSTTGQLARMVGCSDGASSRHVVPCEVTVTCSSRVAEAGQEPRMMIVVFGVRGATLPVTLRRDHASSKNANGYTMQVNLMDVAPVKKLRLQVDRRKATKGSFHLKKIELKNMATRTTTEFHHDGLLATGKEGSRTCVDIAAMECGRKLLEEIKYSFTVKTSSVNGAGTDANVYIVLFGVNGDSNELHLKTSETNRDPFEKGQEDVFPFRDVLSLGELYKMRVWHDNKGFGAAWHLASIDVRDHSNGRVYAFPCHRWLSSSDDDKQILRELTCGNPSRSPDSVSYEIEVTTADEDDSGTVHDGWLVLRGSTATTEVRLDLANSDQHRILRRGQTNCFTLNSPHLGKLETCTVGACERQDCSIQTAEGTKDWQCDQVTVTDTFTGIRTTFALKSRVPVSKKDGIVCNAVQWEETHWAKVKNLHPVKYEVAVYTGDVQRAGTDANVTITIFGTLCDTGKRPLKQRMRDLFERGQEDKFVLEALGLGVLTRVHMEHDNSGFNPGWLLDRVEVTDMGTNTTTVFRCGQWLDIDHGTTRDLVPSGAPVLWQEQQAFQGWT